MEIIKRGNKPVKDIRGQKFNRLTVVSYEGIGKHSRHYWKCLCECGNYITLPSYKITGSKPTRSCGCLRKEKLNENRSDPEKHGLHKHKLYAVYYGMLYRCYNPKCKRYKYYGGSGISVCDYWRESFVNFYNWAIENGYKEGLSIDRIDSKKNYCPENCQWITLSENSRKISRGK